MDCNGSVIVTENPRSSVKVFAEFLNPANEVEELEVCPKPVIVALPVDSCLFVEDPSP